MLDSGIPNQEDSQTRTDALVGDVAREAVDLESERRPNAPRISKRGGSGPQVLLGPRDPKVGDDDLLIEQILLKQRNGIRNPKARVHRIHSIEGLARFLKKHRRLGRLMLTFHTDQHADMKIGNEWMRIDGARVRDVLAPIKARVDTVEFQSCRVGFRPDRMAVFGRLLNARTVVGWTAWRVIQRNTVPLIGRDATDANLRRVLQAVEHYLAVGSPTIDEVLAMKKIGRKHIHLVIEGFLRGELPGPRQMAALRIPDLDSDDPISDFFSATRHLDARGDAEERTFDGATIGEFHAPTLEELRNHFCRVTVRLPRRNQKGSKQPPDK